MGRSNGNSAPTPVEIMQYCVDFADSIYVVEEVDGRRDSVRLCDLPETRARYWIERWCKERRVPHRILRSARGGLR